MEKRKYNTYSFEKLDVWKLARQFKSDIYKVSQGFPRSEWFGLTSQMRRAASSMTSNLAEGSGRATSKDQAYFTNMAYASALETVDHLITAKDLDFIDDTTYDSLRTQIDPIIAKLNGLYRYQLHNARNLKSHLRDQNQTPQRKD